LFVQDRSWKEVVWKSADACEDQTVYHIIVILVI
jgi:hypothetical protein